MGCALFRRMNDIDKKISVSSRHQAINYPILKISNRLKEDIIAYRHLRTIYEENGYLEESNSPFFCKSEE